MGLISRVAEPGYIAEIFYSEQPQPGSYEL